MNNEELIEHGLKECDDCYGTGEVPDSYHDKTGKGDVCSTCNGFGYVPYTEEDALNDAENENIGNKTMMKDGD